MKTLKIEEEKALLLYPKATEEFRLMLEDTFGADFFKRDITDRIKTYEDACEVLGIDSENKPNVSDCENEDIKSILAYHKLIIICRALNEGWKPNWTNSNEYKYYPWFQFKTGVLFGGAAYNGANAGFVFSGANYAASYANAYFGSRLCFKTSELAKYAGVQFCEIWNDYLK